MDKLCKTCKYFIPAYHSFGMCSRQRSPGSKMFTSDDGKSSLLVHITFGCNQYEEITDFDKDTL